MNTDILQKIIAEWVQGTEIPELTPREQAGLDLGRLRQILAVVGPRRAGKTYFLYQMISELLGTGKTGRGEILFVDFEDYRLKDFRPEDMERLLAAFYQITGRPPRYLFFDEIQRLPSWSRVLRTLHNSRKYIIVVTGSNATLLSSKIATELRGRYEDRLILPFSFREYLRYRGIAWNRPLLATPESGIIARAFDEFLRYGGFPELAGLAGETVKRRLLQTYFDTIFYKDVLDRHGIRARYLLELMMRNMLEGYASMFSISTFEKQIKAHGQAGSKRSIAEYLRHLEEAFFITMCEKFDYSPRKRMMNPKKIYLMDTGFSLLGGAFAENRGHLLENTVALGFFRSRRRMLYYKGKGECDFIIQQGLRPVEAWQACWELNVSNEKREIKGLLEAMHELKIKAGGILTYGQEETRSVDGVTLRILPVWKWLLAYSGEE
ncbi:MAG: ATP-binding protein [Proteobacteria bacterium]|nr:ATP-binding protein [Pseudomonadota bacterium]